jgi:hypothetical protein
VDREVFEEEVQNSVVFSIEKRSVVFFFCCFVLMGISEFPGNAGMRVTSKKEYNLSTLRRAQAFALHYK